MDKDQLFTFYTSIFNDVIEVLKYEERLLRLSSPTYIFGDLHGNFMDLKEYEKQFWKHGIEITPG